MPLAADPQTVAPSVTVILLLGGATIWGFGYAVAVMHRANADYKATKEAVKKLRKGFWASWWNAVKKGTFIALFLLFLGAWVISSTNKDADAKPTPSPSATSKRR